MAGINLSAYYANKAALAAKGFGAVEDLGGDVGPVTATDKLNDANAAAVLGLASAPQQLIDSGMSATSTTPWAAPEQKPPGSFIVEPPPEAQAIVEAANPAVPPPIAPTQGSYKDPATGRVYEMDAAAIPHPVASPAPKLAAPSMGGGPAPHPLTMADKESAVLLPGQKASFDNDIEAAKVQNVWSDAIVDKRLEIEKTRTEMEARALAEQEAALAREKHEREEFDQYFQGEQNKLAQESDKIANAKMDPNRLFKGERGWLAVTGAVAASIFGIMGAPATNGKNAGVEAVNAAINRDLALQEKDLDNAKAGVSRKSTLLSQKYAVFGDKQKALAAARIDAWKLAAAKAESYAQQSGQEAHVLEAAKFRDFADREIEKQQEVFGIGVEAGWKQMQAAKAASSASAAASNAAKLAKQNEKDDDAMRDVLKKQIDAYGGGAARVSPVLAAKYAAENPDKAPLAVGQLVWIRPDGQPSPLTGGESGGSTVTTLSPSPAGGFSTGSAVAKSKEHAKKWEETNGAITESISAVDAAIAARENANGGKVFDAGAGEAMGTDLALKVKSAAKGMASDKDMELIQTMVPKDVLETHPVKGMLPGDDPTMTKLKLMKDKLEQKKKINDATNLKPGQPGTEGAPSTLSAPVK